NLVCTPSEFHADSARGPGGPLGGNPRGDPPLGRAPPGPPRAPRPRRPPRPPPPTTAPPPAPGPPCTSFPTPPRPALLAPPPPRLVPVARHGLALLRLLAVRERHASRLPLAALHRLELRGELVVRARRRHGHPLGHAGRGLGPDLDAHQLLHDVGLHPADHVL